MKKSKFASDVRKVASLEKKLFAQTHVKKKESYRHIRFDGLLKKAGLSISYPQYRKLLFHISLAITFAITVVVLFLGVRSAQTWQNISLFMSGLWTAGFAFVYLFTQMCAAVFLDSKIDARRKEVERVLPDFLQLAAANIGAGMPIDRALWFAIRPRFGVLASEIERVAKQVVTGVELSDALSEFTTRYESPLLTRSINLLLEGVAAGGSVANLLHTIAVDIQEQRIVQKELAANIMTYVIFISFAAVGAAPLLFGLATQLLVVIQTIASNVEGGSNVGMFSISGDVVALSDFTLFAYVLLSGTAIISALLVGVLSRGSAKEGLGKVPIYVGISLTLYTISRLFFASLFSGIL